MKIGGILMKKSQIISIILLALFISSLGFGITSKTEKDVEKADSTKAMQTEEADDSITLEKKTVQNATNKPKKKEKKESINLDSLPRNEAFIEKYHSIAISLSSEYKIPWEAVMAQGILESAAGTSNFARTRNNFFGIAAYTEDPSQALSFETPEAGWRGYYENIINTSTYLDYGVCKGKNITDPYVYIETITAAGYCESPDYVKQVQELIGEVESYAEKRNW